MYLLDTNIVSELRKPRPHGAVLAWCQSLEESQMFVSAVTIGEIQAGIEITRSQNPDKAAALSAWLDQFAQVYQVLPMDATAFRCWARLMHRRADSLYEDAMIAALAQIHGLTVATRNVKDFVLFGVPVFNPFTGKTGTEE